MIDDYAALLVEVAAAFGIRVTVTSTHRTREKQTALRARLGAAAAAPGRSQHEYGLAFDAVADGPPSHQRFVGTIGEALGLYWGGRFRRPDPVHFQLIAPSEWQRLLRSRSL